MRDEVPGPADVGPGSDATLNALYDLVPGAEEVDLAEEARLEQEQAWALENAGFVEERVPAPAAEDGEEPDPPAPEERLSDGQVQGLLEHLLGAEVIADDDGPRDHE